ncbi:hypothetical protein [Oscillatoria sp. HE19RPO]|uniref:hypothetical protein n=1 Tax=Oscillatoria sp. HE19RPO TaxID=2954806 RepID=UPI0020C222AD|nr:hypothetical protein [Oscillatoria sp. HE19RPO]
MNLSSQTPPIPGPSESWLNSRLVSNFNDIQRADFRYNQETARVEHRQNPDANQPVRPAKTQESWRGDRPSRLNRYCDRHPVNPDPPLKGRSSPTQSSKL